MKQVKGFQDGGLPPKPRRARPTVTVVPSVSRAKTPEARAGAITRLNRLVTKAPEVMVKVTGKTKSAAHLKSHLEYISRNGKLELETRDGASVQGRTEVHALGRAWGDLDELNQTASKGARQQSTSIVLGMPKGTDPYAVKEAARAVAQERFGKNHDYVFVLHLDTGKPHVHLTVRNQGEDGKRLDLRKDDLMQLRERFAHQLRTRGVEAEATRRVARGVVKKAEPQKIRHIRAKGETIVRDVQTLNAAKRIEAGRAGPRPWEDTIKTSRSGVVDALLVEAEALAKSPAKEERELSGKIVQFIREMPTTLTRAQEQALAIREQRQGGPDIAEAISKPEREAAKQRPEPEKAGAKEPTTRANPPRDRSR